VKGIREERRGAADEGSGLDTSIPDRMLAAAKWPIARTNAISCCCWSSVIGREDKHGVVKRAVRLESLRDVANSFVDCA
jgi:hypothetical protein